MNERLTGILIGSLLTMVAVSAIGLIGTNINGLGGFMINGNERCGQIDERNAIMGNPEHHLLSAEDMDKDGDGLCDTCNIPVNDCKGAVQI
jgi:hypothetical protein